MIEKIQGIDNKLFLYIIRLYRWGVKNTFLSSIQLKGLVKSKHGEKKQTKSKQDSQNANMDLNVSPISSYKAISFNSTLYLDLTF